MGIKEKGTITPYKYYTLRKNYELQEIANMVGYSYWGLYHWCKRNVVETRRLTDWEIAEEIRKKTPKEIAYEFNVSLDVVYYRLKKLKINPKIQRGIK